jgi:predicted ATP-grasp superfamily ATP-dependent carboligase
MSSMKTKVLVAGADQHQGLAIIQALGLKGISVIACGAESRSLGCYSRYAVERHVYTSPLVSKTGFMAEILDIIQRTRPDVIIPGVESTLIGLDECRGEFEPEAILAAPPSDVLAYAIDKSKTLEVASQLGVPVPATVKGQTLGELLANAMTLRFPVAVKPRGHRLYAATAHSANFKVRYARSLAELQQILHSVEAHISQVLVQECVPGTGVCVGAIADHGIPLAMLAYRRLRELPLTGGVSVVRETIALHERLRQYVTALLNAVKWHGVAMVEFKHDPTHGYCLMEINGRFQASTALMMDAGLNFPSLVVSLHLYGRIDGPTGYRVGIRERWLRGDLEALYGYLIGAHTEPMRRNPLCHLPAKSVAIRNFLRDFRPGTRYDEFKLHDWKPAALECLALAQMVSSWIKGALSNRARRAQRSIQDWLLKRLLPSSSAQPITANTPPPMALTPVDHVSAIRSPELEPAPSVHESR